MLTRVDLAFSFLDPEKTGYITRRQLRMISKKLSQEKVKALMIKVEKKT
jgi:Ca2+-binding EF-hand superfamily protein